jgi:hypothetical protein
MAQLEARGMKEEARETVGFPEKLVDPPFPVRRVSQDLMGRAGQMAPDLVAAPGENRRPEEGQSEKLGDFLEGASRRLLDAGIVLEGAVDFPALGSGPADQDQVFLPGVLGIESPLQQPRILAREGEDNDPGGSPVQAMDRVDKAPYLCRQLLEQEDLVLGLRRAVDHDSPGLRDGHEAFVLMENLDGRRRIHNAAILSRSCMLWFLSAVLWWKVKQQ